MKEKIAYILILTILGISSGFFSLSLKITNASQVSTANVIEEEVKVEFVTKAYKRVYTKRDGSEEIIFLTTPLKQSVSPHINVFINYAEVPLYLLYESLLI